MRRATIDDAEAISLIWESVCAERVYSAVNRPFTAAQERDYIAGLSDREGIFLAVVEGRVAGFQSLDMWASYTDSFDHVGVMGTMILAEWRRRGVGRVLAENTLDFARDRGYEKIVVYVRAGNSGALAFYGSLGFVAKGALERQVKIDGQYEDEIFLEMLL